MWSHKSYLGRGIPCIRVRLNIKPRVTTSTKSSVLYTMAMQMKEISFLDALEKTTLPYGWGVIGIVIPLARCCNIKRFMS